MRSTRSIAITGATGFFGWHLRCRLLALFPDTDVRVIGRVEYDDDALLMAALAGVDAVVHLAGANRGPEGTIYKTNVSLAARLVSALEAGGGSPYLVYANTIHARLDTSYGSSKREAGVALAAWGRRAGAHVGDLRFPNLFGEGGRPNYNSAVATFCHELADGSESAVNPDGRVELLHVQDACDLVLEKVGARFGGTQRIEGQRLSVTDLYERLQRLQAGYRGAEVPELVDRLDLRLFNTLRTAMFPAHYPLPLDDHRDPRGLFVELARGSGRSQTSLATTVPGETRGEHFHLEKIERFIVVAGTGVINLRKLFDDEVISFPVSGRQPVVVDMPSLYAHNITNVGTDDLLTILWANDHFDAGAPDTFPEPVRLMSVGASV